MSIIIQYLDVISDVKIDITRSGIQNNISYLWAELLILLKLIKLLQVICLSYISLFDTLLEQVEYEFVSP